MLRARLGPAVDAEDAPNGFGGHADQERILERDLPRLRAVLLGRRHCLGSIAAILTPLTPTPDGCANLHPYDAQNPSNT